jgi:hypothetical protein
MSATASMTTIDDAETATAVEAAALLVSLAINGTQRPVEEIGDALERLSRAATISASGNRGSAAGSADRDRHSARDVAVCLESLQFHDRLMQQLSFVRDLLSAILKHEPLDMAAYGAPRWEALIALIRRRAPLDARFELFDLLSPAEAREAEGSCELF